MDNKNQQLQVTWDDGHVSPFKYNWLNNHSFTEKTAEKQDNLLFRKPTLWGKELQDKYPTVDFKKVNILIANESMHLLTSDNTKIEHYANVAGIVFVEYTIGSVAKLNFY